jgi:hypothetical protein
MMVSRVIPARGRKEQPKAIETSPNGDQDFSSVFGLWHIAHVA